MPLVATDNEDFIIMQRVRVTTLPGAARWGRNLGPTFSFTLFSFTHKIVLLYIKARLSYIELL